MSNTSDAIRPPKAYVIFIKESMHDEVEMGIYKATVGASFKGHSPSFLAAYGALEVLEGEPAEGVVILEFADMEKARAWYHSPAYQEAAQHRFAGAVYRGLIVEGIAPAEMK
ncbi:MAG: DUF1330 domain-containing protein [Burkholderiales bacterium]|nr:DUF1330 domain-containing protein [Burkholderiales bacterium]